MARRKAWESVASMTEADLLHLFSSSVSELALRAVGEDLKKRCNWQVSILRALASARAKMARRL